MQLLKQCGYGRYGRYKMAIVPKRINSVLFLEFLKRLMRGSARPVFLIVDGSSAHKAKIVAKYIERQKGRLRLFYLPPHYPELNPDEYVWNDVKNNGVGRAGVTDETEMRRAIESRLRLLQKNPERVQKFFQSETTRYAA